MTSPRNSLYAHSRLLETLDCNIILSPEPKSAIVTSIVEQHYVQYLAVPAVAELLGREYPHYEYSKTYSSARSEPFVVMYVVGPNVKLHVLMIVDTPLALQGSQSR